MSVRSGHEKSDLSMQRSPHGAFCTEGIDVGVFCVLRGVRCGSAGIV